MESLFKEVMFENFPKLRRKLDIQVHKANKSPKKLNLKSSSPRHIVINLSNLNTKNLKSSKRTESCNIQENLRKVINRFLIRNLTGQKKVGGYIQSNKRKTLVTKNTLGQCCFSEMKERKRYSQANKS